MGGPVKLPSCPEIKSFFPEFRVPLVHNFLLLVYCVLAGRSLSLYRCAEYVPGEALFDSKYRRLLRFVRIKRANAFCQGVARLLLAMAPTGSVLVMDRTNWRRGQAPVNLLCLGLLVDGRFYLPLLCMPLLKHGASNQDERIALIKQFITLLGSAKGYLLLADREFAGKRWLRWLRSQGMEVLIRLRDEDYADHACRSGKCTPHQFRRKVHRKGSFSIRFKLEGYWFYYTGLIDQTVGGDVFYLLSSRPCARESAQLYAKRWSIEVFFKQLKSAGFQLESTGLTDPRRLAILMAVASVAYLMALEEGITESTKRPIKTKQTISRSWPEISVFRYGLRALVGKIRTLWQLGRWIKRRMQRIKKYCRGFSAEKEGLSVQY